MSDTNPFDGAITVNSILEEYEYLRKQKCKCGGNLERKMQSLMFNEDNIPFDLLTCECSKCEEKEEFYFNISSFFGKNI